MLAICQSYLSAGLCVLPARTDQKRPLVSGWKQYQSALPTDEAVAAWFKSCDACCLLTGAVSGNLELLDFDCAGEAFATWSELVSEDVPGLLDRLVVETSPSGGRHVVYRCSEPVCGNIKLASRREDFDGPDSIERFGKRYTPRQDSDGRWHIVLTMIETRGEGGLFLCHPSPGYDLVQGDLTAPPVLSPAEREILLRAAWSLDQVPQVPMDREPSAPRASGRRPGDDFNQRAEVAPILLRHGWTIARDGSNQYWRRPGKSQGWSATLKDGVLYCFSSNAAPFEPNQAYSPFAVYVLLEHGGDFSAASRALRSEGYGDPLPEPAAIVSEEVPPPDPPDPGPVPTELLQIPGFIGQVMDFCLATAPYPNPVLAFCGAVTLQGLLAGRRVRDEADNRSNLYLLGLANSGAGKDHPRKLNQRILLESELVSQVGDSFASSEGIEDRMLLTPCMLFQTDEMDALLLAIREGKDGRSERIMQALLKFYTAANAIYPMRVKAGKEPEFINQPCLSIFGTAIPQHFYEALSAKMLSNGFFARMLVLEAGKRGTGQAASTPPIPDGILSTVRWWRDFQPGKPGNLGILHPTPLIVPSTTDARAALAEVRHHAEQAYDTHEHKADQMGMAIWARAAEKVHRLALIYACSENHLDPIISGRAVAWAWQLTEHQTQRMIAMAALHVYEGDFDQRQKRVVQTLRATGGQLTQRAFNKALRWMKAQERAEIVQNLIETGQLTAMTEDTGRPGVKPIVYRLTENAATSLAAFGNSATTSSDASAGVTA